MSTIGYVCASDPFKDRKAWSGIIFKMREAIEKAGYQVVWIPYCEDTILAKIIKWSLTLKKRMGGVII